MAAWNSVVRASWLLTVTTIAAAGCGVGDAPSSAAATDPIEPAAATAAALRRLERETGRAWALRASAGGVGVHHLDGRTRPLLVDGASAEEATRRFVDAHRDLFQVRDVDGELRLLRASTSADGWRHARFQQRTRGLDVWGRQLVAHFDPDGALATVYSHYAPGLDAVDVEPAVARDDALAAAAADVRREDPTFDEATGARPPAIDLVVFVDDAGAAHLAWHVRLFADDVVGRAPSMPVRMIDAKSGAVLLAYDDLQSASAVDATAMGTNVSRSFRAEQQNGQWVLVDDTRPKGLISTRNANYQTPSKSGSALVSSSDKDSGWDPAGVDAQFGASTVWDFYRHHFQRDSWDGKGGALLSYIHVPDPNAIDPTKRKQLNNAFWNGSSMNYGDGDGKLLTKLSAGLDVCAHELTHGVTGSESALVYDGESGALNESISDVFGTLVEHEVEPDPARNATIGEDVIGSQLKAKALRSMANPLDGYPPQPAVYKGQNWATGSQDNGGVHTNSGVPNNAFWLMTAPGATNPVTHVGPATTLSWENSARVWYKMDTDLLQPQSTMADAAQASLDAVKQLGLGQADRNIVECAWIAVGVLTGSCKDTSGGSGSGGGGSIDAGAGDASAPTDAGAAPDAAGASGDAGAAIDAGGGAPGAGGERDAGGDPGATGFGAEDGGASTSRADGGATNGLAASPSSDASGCACSAASRASSPRALPALAAVGVAAALRRRRRRRRV